MCGITGFIDRRQRSSHDELTRLAAAMADAIRHRGPDAQGVWADEQTGVGLGHRRLSVIDVSDAGAQPMLAPSGRYVVVYNGEIYNYTGMREELEDRGHSFRGHSDTEALVRKLTPGSLLTLGPKDPPWSREPVPFWSAREIAEKADKHEFEGSYAEAVDQLDGKLRKAISHLQPRLNPLGARPQLVG